MASIARRACQTDLDALDKAKKQEMKMIKQRGGMRIAKILDVVEQTLNPIQHENGRIRFSIRKEDIHKMLENSMNVVLYWGGGSGARREALRKKNEAKKRQAVRNFWNHHKAEKLGDYIFSVIFSMLFQALTSQLSAMQSVLIFIDTFRNVAEATVRFTRTRAMPLICHSSYLKSKRFMNLCKRFFSNFGTDLNYSIPKTMQTIRDSNGLSKTLYVSDSKRAETQHISFLQCLIKVRTQLEGAGGMVGIGEKVNDFKVAMGWEGRDSARRGRIHPLIADPPSESPQSEITSINSSVSSSTSIAVPSGSSLTGGRLKPFPSFLVGVGPQKLVDHSDERAVNIPLPPHAQSPAADPICTLPGCTCCNVTMDATCTLHCEHVETPPLQWVGINPLVTTSRATHLQSLHGNAARLHPDCTCCSYDVDNVRAARTRNVHRYDHPQRSRQHMPSYHSSPDYCLHCVSSPCHVSAYRGALAGERCEGAPMMVQPRVDQGEIECGCSQDYWDGH